MTSPTTTGTAPTAPPAAAPAPLPGQAPAGLDLGLLLLRLAVGLTMAAHGSQKLFGWFDGAGLDATGAGFTSMGYPSGETMALVAGLSETFGGLGLALGLFTPLAAAAVLGTMINAVFAVHWESGFFLPAGYEYAMIMGFGAASLALTGPGRLAVDPLLPVPALRTHRTTYGAAALGLAVVTAVVVLLLRD
ncbi:DoxX family protein [Streptomyces sp. MP131-18]|uniref:DoxX family protein n=1 Tax=Streptomyces sp. MP131-18 TaxID=1857892 RepID=UPI00097C7F72|nr:DoxX family protein [Streptomyces sp. MP131-18]ONK15378.1 putative oxidoreductase MhqP [Streptomyces sp. MP131-18]